MLVKKFDVSIVDPLCDLLAHLMRTATLNHVQSGPPILRLGPRGRAHEEGVLEFALQLILLDVVGQSGRDFSVNTHEARSAIDTCGFCGDRSTLTWDIPPP